MTEIPPTRVDPTRQSTHTSITIIQTRPDANQLIPDDARPPSFSSHWHPILLRTSAHITRHPTRPPNHGASLTITFKFTYPVNLYYYRPSGLVPKTALRHYYASGLPLAENRGSRIREAAGSPEHRDS